MREELPRESIESPRFSVAITAYGNQEALLQTLRFIVAQQSVQIQRILILDNSPTPLIIPHFSKIPIDKIQQEHNPGLVSSVNIAWDWARAKKMDFLWMFDQDSQPAPDCLFQLWKGWQSLEARGFSPGIVAPEVHEFHTNRIHHGYEYLGYRYRMIHAPQYSPEGDYFCDMVIHSGTLLSVTPPSLTEPLPDWIFLDALEHAIAEQVLKQQKVIAVISKAKLQHHYGNPKVVQEGNKELLLQDYPPLRYYTICRNQTWFEIRHAVGCWNRFRAILYAIKRCRKFRKNILRLQTSHSGLKRKLCITGTWAGIMGTRTIPEIAKVGLKEKQDPVLHPEP